MEYRREIDGLRTVAVLPVILYHAGIPLFQGGFVGVDVFFVISGFLITTILIDELERGDFSILRFYERRARRILPALFFMMAVCLPLGWRWMLPEQFKDFAASVVAVCAFVSNILFWREEDYFAPTADEKPLLHTWSLAVEEQYYLIFPVALFLVWALGRRRVGGLVFISALASFALMELARHMPSIRPAAVFYLAPTRAWELLACSVCAFLTFRRSPVASQGLAGLGLAMILGAVFLIDKTFGYPSPLTLIPVLGTCLVLLFATPATLAGQILSLRPMVGIGLISYSAYLWHQPLLAFARIRSLTDPGMGLMLGLSLLSLLLAWFSWRYVERPFRGRGSWPGSRRAVFAASGAGMVVLALAGATIMINHGFATRLSPLARSYLTADTSPYHALIVRCQKTDRSPVPAHPISGCLSAPDGQGPRAVLLGDSHAGAIGPAVFQSLVQAGIPAYMTANTGCVGLPGFYRADWPGRNCDAYTRAALDYARKSGAQILILTGRLPLFYHGGDFDNGAGVREKGDPVRLDVIGQSGGGEAARKERLLAGYKAALEELSREFDLVVVRPIPPAGWDVPTQLAKLDMFAPVDRPPLATPQTAYERWIAPLRPLYDQLDAASPRVVTVDPAAILCHEGLCLNESDHQPLYSDDDHLSEKGARMLAPAILAGVQALIAQEDESSVPDQVSTGPRSKAGN